jgi:hypothetical protein
MVLFAMVWGFDDSSTRWNKEALRQGGKNESETLKRGEGTLLSVIEFTSTVMTFIRILARSSDNTSAQRSEVTIPERYRFGITMGLTGMGGNFNATRIGCTLNGSRLTIMCRPSRAS